MDYDKAFDKVRHDLSWDSLKKTSRQQWYQRVCHTTIIYKMLREMVTETTVSGAHSSLNVAVQALKTTPAENVQKVQQKMTLLKKCCRMLEDRRWWGVDDVAKIIGISYERVHHTLTEVLGWKTRCARSCCIFWVSSPGGDHLHCSYNHVQTQVATYKPLVLKSHHLLTHLQFRPDFRWR